MQPAKLLAGTAVKIKIAIAAVALLVIGAWLAPTRQSALAPPAERAAPLLEEQVQQRGPATPFRGVQDIAERIDVYGVALHVEATAVADNDFAPYRPAAVNGFGVPLGNGFVLTHRRALDGARQVQIQPAAGAPFSAQLAAYDDVSGLVLLRTQGALSGAARVATEPPPVGSLAVAAARWPEQELLLPVFIALVAGDHMRIGGDSGMAASGLPIFDAEGRLVAVSIGRGEARPVRAAIDRLLQRAMAESQPKSLGLAFQEVTDDLRPVFGDSGAIVVDVLPGGPAARAGLRAGDVITAVAGTAVTGVADVSRIIAASLPAPTPLAVRRAGKPLVVEADPIDAFDAAALADRRPEDNGVPAARLLTSEQLAEFSIPAEARIESINGQQPVTAALVRRELARRAPAALLIADGARRYFVVSRRPS
jgi:S1-C subfamily serine protease